MKKIILEKDVNVVIGNCLKSAFGIDKYMYLINAVKKPDIETDEKFCKIYNNFYRLRYGNKEKNKSKSVEEWYKKYYSLLKEQTKKKRSFKTLLKEMYKAGNRIEASFVSKLMATVNVDLPIWDSYVLKYFDYKNEWEKTAKLSPKDRINIANQIYEKIKKQYEIILESDDGKAWIAKFDELLPDYKDKISDVKKIDFMIWGQGSPKKNNSNNSEEK